MTGWLGNKESEGIRKEPERRYTMRRQQLNNFVLLAMFTALIILLGFTPLGMIPLGFINVTILCVPVVIGTMYMGLKNGLVLGVAFGAVSFINALIKPSALVSTLMGASPLLGFVMAMLPRMLVPLATAGAYTLVSRWNKHAAAIAGAICGSLTNTVLYLGLMLLFYILCGIDTAGVLSLIGGVALIAGTAEAAAAAVLSTPILAALHRVRK